ncbi:MAG: hypothetical protein CM15mP58_11840 [Burkholderiaceae bacterium]|nr:MAG: hypothetical protein CM15mP58_11840 [Burkholderiaceae bacterium]
MKWLFICVWLISILFFYFRGKIRPTFGKTFIRPQRYTSATQCLTYFVLERKISAGPFISKEHFSDMELITENWNI